MRNVLSVLLACLTGLLPAAGMANPAGPSCGDVFQTVPGIIISTGMFSLEEHMDPAKQAKAILSLLQMTNYTLGESFSKKLTLEKGELYLGQPLNAGWSLEFEYSSDKRTENPAFRLSKISLVRPNGEKNVFEKRPTTIDGLSLLKNHYSPEEMGIKDLGSENPFEGVQRAEAPAVIQGPLLKSFLKFAPLAAYLKREEVNSAESLRGLFLKALGRSNADFMKGIIKKQAFKYVLLGVVLYGYYSQQDLVKGLMHHSSDPWSEIKEKTDTSVMMGIISRYLGIGKKAASKQSPAPSHSGSLASMDETLQQVAGVMKAEASAGGKAQIFVLSDQGAKSVSLEQLLGNSKNFQASENGALLVSLPSSHRLMLLEPGENKQVVTYGLDNVTSPNEYGAVKWAIDHAAE